MSGCATPDRIVRLHDESALDAGGAPFSNILVVGVHTDGDARRRFETGVVRAISDSGTTARLGLDFIRSDMEIDREAVLGAVTTSGADAVLITRLVGIEARVEREAGRTTTVADRRDSIPMADFFRYEYTEYEDPMVSTIVQTVVLETDLYRVSDESRIWSVQSTSIDKASIYETVDSVSRALTNALSNDGLIR